MNTLLTTLLRTSLVTAALITISACGQKGPLILEQIPAEQSQATLENSIDEIPLETPSQATSESATEEVPASE